MNTRKLLVSVLMFVSVLLSACVPAPTPPIPTAVSPTSAPTAIPPTAIPNTNRSFHLFELPVSISFDSEWSVLEKYKDVFTLRGHDVHLAFIYVKYLKIAGPEASADAEFSKVPFPDDFAAWIQAHGLFHVVETQPVIVGGFQGTQINTNATAACGGGDRAKVWIFLRDTVWRCEPGVDIRFILLDNVYGERVLIMTIKGGPSPSEDFMLGGEAVQKVLDTVVFSEP